MHPPVFTLANASAAVTALLGSSDACRVYPFGEAPAGVAHPYAVWQLIGGQPENYLGEAPDYDSLQVQLDVYGHKPTKVRAAAKALATALETAAIITRWGGTWRDQKSRHYRISFDVEFLTER